MQSNKYPVPKDEVPKKLGDHIRTVDPSKKPTSAIHCPQKLHSQTTQLSLELLKGTCRIPYVMAQIVLLDKILIWQRTKK